MIEGQACDRIQSGTGFVVAPGLIATNAHVVAGERTTQVQRDDGRIVRSVNDAQAGERLDARLQDGVLRVIVE